MALEDYTGYTETDPNSRFSVATNTITVTGLSSNEDAYVYDDKGVDHFEETYNHTFDAQVTSASTTATLVPWSLANIVDDAWGIQGNASEDGHEVFFINNSGTLEIRLREIDGASFYTDIFSGFSLSTRYYFTVERVSGGSFGIVNCYIYSDSARTTLVDTLSLTLHADHKFRYVYAAQSFNIPVVASLSGDVQNLDIGGEVTGFIPFFFDAGHY